MSDPQGIVTYPGLATFTKAEYVLSQGISPGKCTIELPQELVGALEPTGDLTIEYATQTIRLPNCLVDSAHIDQSEKGYIARVTILDRRWLWKFGYISGHYNLRMPGGQNADEGFNSSARNQDNGGSTNIRPGTEQAPQDLATLCLQAMNEQNYDVSALPNDPRPEVDWSYTNPAEALQSLCEGLGCRVVYWLANDSVKIVTIGQGQPLPDNGLQTFISEGVDPPNTPSSIKLVGGPWVYQGFIPLTAVGIDTDGSVQEIDDLSYTPLLGWESEVPGVFPSFDDDPDIRALVEKSIYRMWRLDLPVRVPGKNAPAISDIRQLKLYNRLVDTHFDPSDTTKTVPKLPEIRGVFDSRYAQTAKTPTSTHGVYNRGITIDENRWLIITDDTLFSIAGGDYVPANIQIKIAYSVRDRNTWEFVRYTKDKQLNSAVPTQPRIIRREDIFGKAVGSFDDQFNLTGFTDSTDSDNLNQEADYHLQAAAQEYIEQDSLDVPYAGLVPIQVDGLIQQVTYTIASGPGGSTMTRASLATEHNPFVLPWPARRRNEKERHARPGKSQDGRSVLDTRGGGF
ncbi:MAG TPA: hypothetical protein VGP63_29465 [Planctomycetaceae bacterium]|jgi:hypothetical protein|nr:hypothetical protein [Planctomycetaceae bacterium]